MRDKFGIVGETPSLSVIRNFIEREYHPTFEESRELKARVDKTIAFLRTLEAAQIDGSEDRDISLVRRGETSIVKGQAYLLEQAMPNFYFHITTAYAIQRHNGVEVGKRVFLGAA